jgi:hypothetical protein
MTKRVTKQEAEDFIRSYHGRTLIAIMNGNAKEARQLGITYKKMNKIYDEIVQKELEKPFTDEVSKFMKENPDAESVRDEMANLLENGSANTLHDAFLKAMIGKALDSA